MKWCRRSQASPVIASTAKVTYTQPCCDRPSRITSAAGSGGTGNTRPTGDDAIPAHGERLGVEGAKHLGRKAGCCEHNLGESISNHASPRAHRHAVESSGGTATPRIDVRAGRNAPSRRAGECGLAQEAAVDPPAGSHRMTHVDSFSPAAGHTHVATRVHEHRL